MLKIKNLNKNFIQKGKKKKILENINLEINENEIVALLGISGSGKTTLARIIAAYLFPDQGEIFLNNIQISQPNKKIILINQDDDLFPWITVYQNMLLATSNKKNIDYYLNLTNLKKYQDYFPGQLSGGMKKRLSLARALAADAQIIILDEPFASQDIKIKEYLYQDLIRLVRNNNKALLLITHDIEEVINFTDRILILSGQPATIIQDYSKAILQKLKKNNSEEAKQLKKNLKRLAYNIN